MILQSDPRLPKAINNWGCYFMSVLSYSGKEYIPEEIEAIYKSAMATGIIGKEVYTNGVLTDGCFVNDPVALFNLVGVKVKTVIKMDANYRSKPNEKEIQHWHRDADTPKGQGNSVHDHFVTPTYDGLGKSNTCKYGYLKSKRIFK